MPSGDSRKPRQPTDSQRTSPDARTPQSAQSSDAAEQRPQDVDFGSYVSSTVRSSAELFGTPARKAPSRGRRTTRQPEADQAPIADDPMAADAPSPPAGTTSVRETTRRSSRYWRDTVEPADEMEDTPADVPVVVAGGGGGMNGIRDRMPWAFDDEGKPTLPVLGGIAALALLLLLIVWMIMQGGAGDDGTPTETPAVVIGAPTDPVDSPADDSTPAGFQPPATTEPDLTPLPTRGGDNQRSRTLPDITPGADGEVPLQGIDLGPVAASCPERCLVRYAGGSSAEQVLREAQTRASFAADGWYWAIASPEGIAWLEQNGTTTLVTTSADTLPLYITRVPREEASGDRVSNLGEVLDSAGDWRLLRAAAVPANVRPLTSWGYEVYKMAPAPPLSIEQPEEPTDITTIEIGSLIDDVSDDNLEESIVDLIGMGSSDGSGVGTRYYTSAANMQAAEYLFNRLEAYGLDVWYEDFLTWEGYLMVNVIGEIPGADPSAIYGVMAHFDTISSDLAVSPGADDNATGVAASLEIARVLSEYELHHPVRVIFVNVEEVGIVGSQHFAKDAAAEGVPYEGVFNLDSVGAQRQYSYVVINGSSDTVWMSDLMVRLNKTYGLNQTINAMTNDAIVADDNRLREHGIDSIMIGRELYGQSPYHHTPGDLIDTISVPSVGRATQLTLLALAALVQA